MSPAAGEGAACRPPSAGALGGGRGAGLRESNQALAELKTKLEFALSRLNDQDTQRTGLEEIREFLQALYPDWFPMVISCIGEAGANLKPLGRCESVKLLGLLAELQGEALVPLLQRVLQVVVTRLQDADLHLREACAETVERLASALVVDGPEGSPVLATLLKPLFGALGEHNKFVQIGAANCICSVIQGSPPPVIRENLGRLCSRLVQHLSLPLAQAKPQLLSACVYAMQAVEGPDFDEVLPSLMPCLETCLQASSDWQTRKQAVEVLQVIGDCPELGQSLDLPLPPNPSARPTPFQRRIATALEVVRADKVRAVREAVKDVMLRWSITKQAGPLGVIVRSSSPTAASMAGERESRHRLGGDRPDAARSCSPGPASVVPFQDRSTGGQVEVRTQSRGVRSVARERVDALPEEVSVSVADDDDIAAKKAARDSAVRAALLGADLNNTKKPRPKRERVSIFSGPTNSKFFNSARSRQGRTDDSAENVLEIPPPSPRPDSETSCARDEDEDYASEVPTTASSSVGTSCSSRGTRSILMPISADDMAAPRRGAETRPKSTLQRSLPNEHDDWREHGSTASSAGPNGWPDNMTIDQVLDEVLTQECFSPDGHRQLPRRATPRQDRRAVATDVTSDAASSSSRAGEARLPFPSGREESSPSRRASAARRQAVSSDVGEGGQHTADIEERRHPEEARHELPRTPPESSRDAGDKSARRRHLDEHQAQHRPPAESVSPPAPHPPLPLLTMQGEERIAPHIEGGSTSSRQGKEFAAGEANVAASDRDSQPAGVRRVPGNGCRVGPPTPGRQVDVDRLMKQLETLTERLNLLEERHRSDVDTRQDATVAAAAAPTSDNQDDIDFLMTQLETLSERLVVLEEEKHCAEEQLAARLDKLARTCESQSEVLKAQQEQLETQERRLQMQEQQLKLQDQRLKQQERKLSDQGKQLEEQQLQLQQQDQQFEQQDQQLQEHEQQLEQQEQKLEEHGAVLEELVASGKASPDCQHSAEPHRQRGAGCEAWAGDFERGGAGPAHAPRPLLPVAEGLGPLGGTLSGLAGSSGERPNLGIGSGLMHMSFEAMGAKCNSSPKKAGLLWERLVELCSEQRFLEAYKQAIAEPEESCLLRLMRHTGPIVERLDAESNSRLIRRLIHILSSPSKDCAAASIEQIFAWLRQALTSGIHFTASQVEDLAAALQRVASPQSPLHPPARAEASQLLTRVSALRRS